MSAKLSIIGRKTDFRTNMENTVKCKPEIKKLKQCAENC